MPLTTKVWKKRQVGRKRPLSFSLAILGLPNRRYIERLPEFDRRESLLSEQKSASTIVVHKIWACKPVFYFPINQGKYWNIDVITAIYFQGKKIRVL